MSLLSIAAAGLGLLEPPVPTLKPGRLTDSHGRVITDLARLDHGPLQLQMCLLPQR